MTDVLLAQKWADQDPNGWWLSEKLDGVRALWRGGEFVSRGGKTFQCPDWFRSKMPMGCVLDGELWAGRRQFQKVVGIVKSKSRASEWEFLTFMVFDILQEGTTMLERRPFEERQAALQRVCKGDVRVLKAVPMQKCLGREHLMEMLSEVERRGGEGLMLRQPGSIYDHRRSLTLLKVKSFHDEEAVIVSYEKGKGRNEGLCGALICKTPDGRQFKVGSGLSDVQRRHPPKIDAVITYRYQELTDGNIPRFPTLVGERTDLTWHQVCATYVPPVIRTEHALKRKHSVLFGEEGCSGAGAGAGASSSGGFLRLLSHADVRQLGVAEEDLEDVCSDNEERAKRPRIDTAAVERRPLCIYGAKCYRKNPQHFLEFAHPWRDEENQEHDTIPGIVSVGASAEPAMLREAISPERKGGAAAAKRSPEPFNSRLASQLVSHTTTFLGEEPRGSGDPVVAAPLATSSIARDVIEVPSTSTVPGDIPQLLLDKGEHGEKKHEAGLLHPPLPQPMLAATSGTRAEAVAAPTSDVRIFALRNLLLGLSQDGGSTSERRHFTHLLALLDAGPSSTAIAANAAAVDGGSKSPPPLRENGEMSVLDAAEPVVHALLPPATLAASVSPDARPAPGPIAAASHTTGMAEPGRAVVTVTQAAVAAASIPAEGAAAIVTAASTTPAVASAAVPDLGGMSAVTTLQNMGFASEAVATALKQCGSELEPALEWLLAHAAAAA